MHPTPVSAMASRTTGRPGSIAASSAALTALRPIAGPVLVEGDAVQQRAKPCSTFCQVPVCRHVLRHRLENHRRATPGQSDHFFERPRAASPGRRAGGSCSGRRVYQARLIVLVCTVRIRDVVEPVPPRHQPARQPAGGRVGQPLARRGRRAVRSCVGAVLSPDVEHGPVHRGCRCRGCSLWRTDWTRST